MEAAGSSETLKKIIFISCLSFCGSVLPFMSISMSNVKLFTKCNVQRRDNVIECANILITVTKYNQFVINYPIMLLALFYETFFLRCLLWRKFVIGWSWGSKVSNSDYGLDDWRIVIWFLAGAKYFLWSILLQCSGWRFGLPTPLFSGYQGLFGRSVADSWS